MLIILLLSPSREISATVDILLGSSSGQATVDCFLPDKGQRRHSPYKLTYSQLMYYPKYEGALAFALEHMRPEKSKHKRNYSEMWECICGWMLTSLVSFREDVFRAMHLDLDIAKLYLKLLLIGELAPEEPSQERHKSSQLVEDFRELRRTLEAMNMFKVNPVFFFLQFAQILILETLAWLIVWHFGSGWPVTIFISFLLTISQVQCFFLQHDFGHTSIFPKSKWSRLMQKFVMSHLKGLSTCWWNHRHFQHHVKTNIYPKDPDINTGPLFVNGYLKPAQNGKKKISYINYEKQHLCFYMVGLFLLMPVYANLMSMEMMYLFSERFLESPWVAYVTQMSHVPMRISKEENRDWLSAQVLATCNVEQSFFNDWFTGHLNFQIEHHLFPTMPCHNYHKVAPLVRSLCAKHGLQYVNKPLLKAFGDITRDLKKSATLWMDAYYET
ncbi:fatty acid desaturase 2-like protein FADS2P1 [Puma concolor]|uniref:Fatty acid desaturase 2-like protein FADS2P1 n=1 Tax=Puma concolor TaxID=9696 RepID=A0A6P6I819_PUMCO|nr:fatty acid desaturase 2-like protein FADS2P1 [Puma concolor]